MSQENPLVPVPPLPVAPNAATGPAGGLLSILTGMPKQSWDSIKPTDEGKRALLYNAKNGAAEPFDKLIGQEVNLADVSFALIDQVSKNDGELVQVLRTIIFDDTGRAWVGQSLGVAKCLAELMRSYGEPTWTPPVRVKFVQRPLADGKRTYGLELIGRAGAKAGQGGGGKPAAAKS